MGQSLVVIGIVAMPSHKLNYVISITLGSPKLTFDPSSAIGSATCSFGNLLSSAMYLYSVGTLDQHME